MQVSATGQTVNELLISSTYTVPTYQREYAWSGTQVQELLDDIDAADESGHFLGPVVLVPSSTGEQNRFDVVDGQQRLATITILLAAIRDRAEQLGQSSVATMANSSIGLGTPPKWRLSLGRRNNSFFETYIQKAPGGKHPFADSARRPSGLSSDDWEWNKGIAKAYKIAFTWVAAKPIDGLEKLREIIVDHLNIVKIIVPDESSAFTFFETLNSRGMDLSGSDLVKNLILGEIVKGAGPINAVSAQLALNNAASSWDEVFEPMGARGMSTRFLRYHLLQEHAKVRKIDIHPRFKEVVNEVPASDLLKELSESAERFMELQDPARIADDAAKKILFPVYRDIGSLGVETSAVALMSARKFLTNPAEIRRVAEAVEILAFRWVVCGYNAQVLESTYQQFAAALAIPSRQRLQDAEDILLKAMPSDSSFEEKLLEASGARLGRYALLRIEQALHPDGELIMDQSRTRVEVEHIMPKTRTKDWESKVKDQADYAVIVERWGNLILLFGKLNKSIKNGPWSVKREAYDKSQLHCPAAVRKVKDWDESAIQRRQVWIARSALNIWPIDGKRRQGLELPAYP
jgi:hypothetical protein